MATSERRNAPKPNAARRRFVNRSAPEVASNRNRAPKVSKDARATNCDARGDTHHIETGTLTQNVPEMRLIHSSAFSASIDIFVGFME